MKDEEEELQKELKEWGVSEQDRRECSKSVFKTKVDKYNAHLKKVNSTHPPIIIDGIEEKPVDDKDIDKIKEKPVDDKDNGLTINDILNNKFQYNPLKMNWDKDTTESKDKMISIGEKMQNPKPSLEMYKLNEGSPFYALLDIEPKDINNPEEERKEKKRKARLLRKKALITIGGVKSTGKSSLVSHLAIEIMKANPNTCFIYFSGDDEEEFIEKRIASQIIREDYSEKDIYELRENKEVTQILNHVYLYDDEITVTNIENRIFQAKDIHKYENILVCYDYLQLLKDESVQHRDKRVTLNECLSKIKKIQQNEGCTFFLLSQLDRATGSYRETSEIENLSDICIDIRFPTISEDDESKPKRIIRISKNKRGERGQKYSTSLDFEKYSFNPFKLLSKSNIKGTEGTEDTEDAVDTKDTKDTKDAEDWRNDHEGRKPAS